MECDTHQTALEKLNSAQLLQCKHILSDLGVYVQRCLVGQLLLAYESKYKLDSS